MQEILDSLSASYTENPVTWITFLITVGGALTLITLERFFPYTPEPEVVSTRFLQRLLLVLCCAELCAWSDHLWPYRCYRQRCNRSSVCTLCAIYRYGCRLGIFLVMHDFYIYWFHRFQHNSKYFWRTHEAHHSTEDVDWLSGSRSHSLEILINQTVEFLPIVLLASPEVAVIKGCVDAVWGMYIHSQLEHQNRVVAVCDQWT